jgi:hypothetical protein
MYSGAPARMSIVSLPSRCPIGEEERDRHPDALHLSGGLEVELHDEVAARLEPPLRPVRYGMRSLPWRPAEQLSFRVTGVPFHTAGVSRIRVARVELPRRARPIDAEIRVVHDAGVPRMEFNRADVPGGLDRDRNDERAEDVASISRNGVFVRHPHHEIRTAQLPVVSPVGRRRQPCDVALRCTVGDPSLQQLKLGFGQPSRALKIAFPGDRFPRRHDPARRHVRNLRRVTPHIVVGDQAERSDLARTMAGRAAAPDDRRDVPGEGRLRLCKWRPEQDDEKKPQRTPRSQRNIFSACSAISPIFSGSHAGLAYQRCREKSRAPTLVVSLTNHGISTPSTNPTAWTDERGTGSQSSSSRWSCGSCTSGSFDGRRSSRR